MGNKRVKIQNVATGRYLGASPKGCGFVDSYGERVWKLVEVTPRDIELCNFSDLENFLQSFYRSVRDYCSQKFSDVPFLNMHRPMVPFRRWWVTNLFVSAFHAWNVTIESFVIFELAWLPWYLGEIWLILVEFVSTRLINKLNCNV